MKKTKLWNLKEFIRIGENRVQWIARSYELCFINMSIERTSIDFEDQQIESLDSFIKENILKEYQRADVLVQQQKCFLSLATDFFEKHGPIRLSRTASKAKNTATLMSNFKNSKTEYLMWVLIERQEAPPDSYEMSMIKSVEEEKEEKKIKVEFEPTIKSEFKIKSEPKIKLELETENSMKPKVRYVRINVFCFDC